MALAEWYINESMSPATTGQEEKNLIKEKMYSLHALQQKKTSQQSSIIQATGKQYHTFPGF